MCWEVCAQQMLYAQRGWEEGRRRKKKKKVYERPVSLAVNGMQLIVQDEAGLSSHFSLQFGVQRPSVWRYNIWLVCYFSVK